MNMIGRKYTNYHNNSNIIKYLVYCFCAIFIFSVVRHEFLSPHPKNDDRMFKTGREWLAGSILKARQDGLFSTGTFTVLWKAEDRSIFEGRFMTQEFYESEQDSLFFFDEDWLVYRSALRWTNSIYVVLDILHWKITGSPKNLIPFHETLSSLLFVFVLLLFLVWVGQHFNLLTAFATGIIICFNSWLVNFASTPGGAIWLELLPFIIGLHLFSQRYSFFNINNKKHLAIYGLISTFVIACNRYEFLPTLMLSQLLPPIFYHKDYSTQGVKNLFSTLFFTGLGALAGFIGAIFLHFFANAVWSGSWAEAWLYFKSKFIYRSSGEVLEGGVIEVMETVETFNAKNNSVWEVLMMYFTGKNVLFKLTMGHLLLFLFATAPISLLLGKRISPSLYENRDKTARLFILLTGSLLAACGFFFVFKAHAVIHPHIDYIIFSLPFMLIFVLFYMHFLILLFKDLLEKLMSKVTSNILMIFLVLLPVLGVLNEKYTWINEDKLAFLLAKECVFDLFKEEESYYYVIHNNSAEMRQDTFFTHNNDSQIQIKLKESDKIDFVLEAKFYSNKAGLSQIFYDYCKEEAFIEEASLRQRVKVGYNKLYFNISPEQCSDRIRFDFIDESSAIIKIEQLRIRK